MTDTTAKTGILSSDRQGDREQLIEMLTKAYWMEVESLKTDVQEELGHATQFGERIKELYGVVPGSLDFNAEQTYLQPPEDQVDIVHVIKGVIEAETGAIEHYNRI